MINSQTVYLSSDPQNIEVIAPFELTIDPTGVVLPTNNKIYKIIYNFGDGEIVEDVLTTDISGNPAYNKHKKLYHLFDTYQKNIPIIVDIYQFYSNSYTRFEIYLTLKSPSIQDLVGNLHLVGTRMFGMDNDILYIFESDDPNYLLPVIVNWKQRPPEPAIKKANRELYRPYKLLAPFENEFVTNIDNGTRIDEVEYSVAPYNPDNAGFNL